jgi:hypothetical protein
MRVLEAKNEDDKGVLLGEIHDDVSRTAKARSSPSRVQQAPDYQTTSRCSDTLHAPNTHTIYLTHRIIFGAIVKIHCPVQERTANRRVIVNG